MAGFTEKFFGDLKLENEGGNLFSFNAAVDGASEATAAVMSETADICSFSALGF